MASRPMPRWFTALPALASALITSPTTALAQEAPVVVEHAGADTLALPPGARGSIPFRVVNRGAVPLRLRVDLDSPAQWRVVGVPPHLELAVGEAAMRVVGFFVPPAAPAGVYSFLLAARADGAAAASGRVFVRVAASPELRVEIEEAPTWAVAGEAYPVTARVTNAGNVPLVFRLALESPHWFLARADTAPHQIDPGASAVLRVEVTPPATLDRALTHPLRIIALAAEDTAQAVARVEVVPHGRQSAPARTGVPADVRLRASSNSRGGSPVRLHAAGPIAGSRTRVEALLQGPSQGYSMFGETDVYRLRLDSPHYSLRLGDDVYLLSQLTEPGQEGVGASVSGRAGPVQAGGFVQRDRRTLTPDTLYAAFAGVSPIRHLELRGNWFRQDGDRGRREVVSAEGTLRVPEWFIAQGEYGVRPSTGAVARSGILTGSRGPLSIHLRHLQGDTAYGGTYAGLSASSGQVGLRPWRALYFEGSLEDQQVERTGTLFAFASTHRSGRLAAGWGSRVSLEGRWLSRGVRGTEVASERSAESLRARVTVPLGPLNVYPTYELGVGRERGSARDDPFWQAGLRSDLGLGRAYLSSNVEYFTGGTLHHSVAEEGVSGTASAALQIGSGTQVNLSAYGTSYFRPLERQNLIVNASLEQRLPSGHRIGLRVFSRASYGLLEHHETIAMLDYSIPLKLPLGRQPRSASISGQLYDVETGVPLSRVIVRVGERRIATDARGRITISGLESGTHYIDVDRASADVGRAPAISLPLRIEVLPGTRSEFEIGMIRSANLSVRTRLTRAASLARPAERSAPEPLATVVLDLRREGERVRRVTDERGEVEVSDLRPGRWTITVVTATLPPFHSFPSDSAVVDLDPGETAAVELVAAPIERQIEIITRGAPGVRTDSLPTGWTTHRAVQNTTLRDVAEKVYGDPELWRPIWDANRVAVPDPESVPVGTLLRIPPVEPRPRR